ncbi:hypothetical protein Pyn_33038 [Prunus yedoensis var. nudiflora]|uniref:FBD domain-containing protein n=1 Tax=Prunus yedoensis var. nudiflora TaxID=2094558 RepID=A0A314XYP6_PRUYE|nr:hypothetical protein Pyn_33038 [Prunus yedoensis var. nudiflora]
MYRGEKEDSFKVAFYLDAKSADTLNAWISFAILRGVEVLDLHLFQLATSSTLKHLRLSRCVLRPPPDFDGFMQLRTLYLERVTVDEVFMAMLNCFNDPATIKISAVKELPESLPTFKTSSNWNWLSMGLKKARWGPQFYQDQPEIRNIDSGFWHDQLKSVTINTVQGNWYEVERAICVLKTATKLEKMVIDPFGKLYYDGEWSWTNDDASGFTLG